MDMGGTPMSYHLVRTADGREDRMGQAVHYNIEGAEFDVPTRYDAATRRELELLPDLLETPIYTPAGERVMLTIEDACENAAPADDGEPCVDCGSCRYYRQAPHTLLGVCGHKTMGKNGNIPKTGRGEKEETT